MRTKSPLFKEISVRRTFLDVQLIVLDLQLLELKSKIGILLEELLELVLVLVNVNVEWRARHMNSRPLDIYLIISSLRNNDRVN